VAALSERPVNRKAERCPRCKYPYHGLPADSACPGCGMQVRTGALVFYGPRRPFAVLDVLYLVLAGWFALALPGNISRQDMILFLCNAVAALLVALLWWSSRRRRYCYVVVDGDRVLYGPGRDAPTELRLHGVWRAEYSALAREVCLRDACGRTIATVPCPWDSGATGHQMCEALNREIERGTSRPDG
jgi:hypothetical protein